MRYLLLIWAEESIPLPAFYNNLTISHNQLHIRATVLQAELALALCRELPRRL
jgi:hypothetical protein